MIVSLNRRIVGLEVASSSGTLADDKYILRAESDALVVALRNSMIEEAERQRKQQASSYTTELANRMHLFHEEWESRMDKARLEWDEKNRYLEIAAERTQKEVESRVEVFKLIFLN